MAKTGNTQGIRLSTKPPKRAVIKANQKLAPHVASLGWVLAFVAMGGSAGGRLLALAPGLGSAGQSPRTGRLTRQAVDSDPVLKTNNTGS
jgi:hypothetical protein